MFTLSDQSQLQASAIKKGNYKLAGAHQEIIGWITKQFGVKALDFSFERREASPASQQLIHIIVETAEDVQHMQANREHTNVITERFRKYLQSPEASNHQHDPLKRSVFPIDTQPPIIVTWRPLKEVKPDIQKEIIETGKRDIDRKSVV